MNTPTGASLRATAYRAALPQFAGSLSLPPLPKINTTWIDQGLTVRPAFFGCEGTPAMLNGSKIASPYPFVFHFDFRGFVELLISRLVSSSFFPTTRPALRILLRDKYSTSIIKRPDSSTQLSLRSMLDSLSRTLLPIRIGRLVSSVLRSNEREDERESIERPLVTLAFLGSFILLATSFDGRELMYG